MKKLYFISIFYLLIISCNQGASKSEKDYIKNLEEKNRALENELQNEKNRPPVIIEKPAEKIYVPQEVPVERNISKDYFTIGSTEDEVLDVMGDPRSIQTFEYSNEKWFYYGFSVVKFKSGRVNSYSEVDRKLKIKIGRRD